MANTPQTGPSDDIDEIIDRGDERGTYLGKAKGEFHPSTSLLLRGKLIHHDGKIEIGSFSAMDGHLMNGKRIYPDGRAIKSEEGDFSAFGLIKGIRTHFDGTTTNVDEAQIVIPAFGTPRQGSPTAPQFLDIDILPAPSTPVVTAEPISPNEESFTDNEGNEWTGVDKDTLTGHGKVIRHNGIIDEGDFQDGNIIEGKRVYPNNGEVDYGIFYDNDLSKGTETYDNVTVRVQMNEGNTFDGKGRKEYFTLGVLEYREEGAFIGRGLYDGKRIFSDGRIATIQNGATIHETYEPPLTSTTPSPSSLPPITQADFDDFLRRPSPQSNPNGPIRSIFEYGRYNNIIGMSYNEQDEWEKGIERVETLIKTLSEDDQRRIGELRAELKPLEPEKSSGKDNPWRVFHLVPWDNTTIEVDPRHLPADDTAITSDLVAFSKHYRYLHEVEGAIRDINRSSITNLQLDYGGNRENPPFPNFKASIEKINKIRNVIAALSFDERTIFRGARVLVLLSGQKLEDYRNSDYEIIISCDSLADEKDFLTEIRERSQELEDKRGDSTNGPLVIPNRTKTKVSRNRPSTGGIFSRTRNRVLGALTGLALLTGGGIGAYRAVSKPAPVAPEPEAPKPPTKPKAPPEATAVKKIDLTTIPVGGKVKFDNLEHGVKLGVVMKDGDGYVAVDKFDLVDRNTAIRLQK